MIKEKYIKYKYEISFNLHLRNDCDCDLTDGGRGLCIFGQYLEKLITAEEFLKTVGDKFYELQYGTFIRTITDDVAVVIGISKIYEKIYLKLDREVIIDIDDINKKSNMISCDKVSRYSNKLKELVQVGDIANGKQIIKIEDEKLYYGYWGDQYILGEVNELLTQNDYDRHVLLN